MLYMVRCRCGIHEIEKKMQEPFPRCNRCGEVVQHVFTAPIIHYNAPGFYRWEKARDDRFPIDYRPEG